MPLEREAETYRREVGRLLAEGHEGKVALIKGDTIIGFYDTWEAARQAGLQKYLLEGHLVQTIREHEPVLRGPLFFRLCRD